MFGTAGPGSPVDGAGRFGTPPGEDEVLGPPLLTDDQLGHDLFGELLEDLVGVRQPSAPQPATITITTDIDIDTLVGRLSALPGTLLLPNGPVPVSRDALRRIGCDSRLNAVLLDAARTPLGASGTHRNATDKKRRLTREMGRLLRRKRLLQHPHRPHHVRPWWQSGRTTLEDLVPLCKSNHHDIHDGRRTLRLRDGRLIDENGWVDAPAARHRAASSRLFPRR